MKDSAVRRTSEPDGPMIRSVDPQVSRESKGTRTMYLIASSD